MQLLRFLCPYAYSVLLGTAWSLRFRKRFAASLAPAVLTHILVVLISGLTVRRLSPGIYGGIAAAGASLAASAAGRRKDLRGPDVRKAARELWDGGLGLFTVFYVCCYFLNHGKRFLMWDEVSHWGMFLKETLRMDALYCMSPVEFIHKDYVPLLTLFETVWCRLSFRYAEPDAYRAVQVFLFSLLLPMFEPFLPGGGRGKGFRGKCFLACSVCIVLLVPLFFNHLNGFRFYHSIYCDLPTAVLFSYCLLEAYRSAGKGRYHTAVLTVGLSALALIKMTAAALLPMVLAPYPAWSSRDPGKSRKPVWVPLLPMAAVPAALWVWFNRFAWRYCPETGIQSYGGMRLSSVRDVFFPSGTGSIPYLTELKETFLHAVFSQGILLRASYAAVILAAAAAFLVLAHSAPDRQIRRKLRVACVWTLGAGTGYALLSYFLYATAFSEYEALVLASYERYMNTFAAAAVLFLLGAYYDAGIWNRGPRRFCALLILLALDLAVFHPGTFQEILPGDLTRDAERRMYYEDRSGMFVQRTSENDRIYIVKRGDNGQFLVWQRYLCIPRKIGGGSIGPAVDEEDVWSVDLTPGELAEEMGGYDYVYFDTLDEAFIEKYSVVFADPSVLEEGAFCRILGADPLIRLE